MLLASLVPARTRAATAAAFAFAFLSVSAKNQSQVKCSRTCVAENCNTIGIRYGKHCGVGWSGCAGEKPCDDLDACCKLHDECVEKKAKRVAVLRRTTLSILQFLIQVVSVVILFFQV